MIKPKIKPCTGDLKGYYLCQIHENDQPNDEAEEQEHWNYLCVGIGKSIEAAYEGWAEDCKTWSKYEHK